MASLSESWSRRQTTFGPIPVNAQHLAQEAVIWLASSDRTIWRNICKEHPEEGRSNCLVSFSRCALGKTAAEHTGDADTRVRPAPSHSVASVMAAGRSVQS
jgi:hypothetical protein